MPDVPVAGARLHPCPDWRQRGVNESIAQHRLSSLPSPCLRGEGLPFLGIGTWLSRPASGGPGPRKTDRQIAGTLIGFRGDTLARAQGPEPCPTSHVDVPASEPG